MKILMIARFGVRSCGPTEVIKCIVPELIKRGHQVDILSPYPFDKEKECLAQLLGMKYFYSSSRIDEHKLLLIIPDLRNYDVAHIHGIYEYRNWELTSSFLRLKIPYIFTIHGNLMPLALKKGYIKKCIAINLFVRKMLNQSGYIHALSGEEAASIQRISIGQIKIIPNGVTKVRENPRIPLEKGSRKLGNRYFISSITKTGAKRQEKNSRYNSWPL